MLEEGKLRQEQIPLHRAEGGVPLSPPNLGAFISDSLRVNSGLDN